MISRRRLPFNLAQYRWRLQWLRKKRTTPTGPFYINIEPTSHCNIRCKLCSYDYSRQPGYMDAGLYEKIIDEAAGINVHEVAHFLAGEPLVHPDLPYMVEYATLSGIRSRVHTNGTLLTEEKSRALLDAGLSFLGVSFDGDDPDTYNSMRTGSDFGQVVDNLRGFLEMKKARGADRPFVAIKVVKAETNGAAAGDAGRDLVISDGFLELFDGLPVDEFKVIHPHDWRGEVSKAVPFVATGDLYNPCMVLWATLSIAWDGRVLGCAADLNGHEVLGDLNRLTMMDIWNSEKLQAYRELHSARRYRDIDLCRDCTFVWWARNPHLAYLASKGWARPVASVGRTVLRGTRWNGKDSRTRSLS